MGLFRDAYQCMHRWPCIHSYLHTSRHILNYQGPKHLYIDLITQGALKANHEQRKTVELLQDLHDRLQTYDPPPIRELNSGLKSAVAKTIETGKNAIQSPDFAWIKDSEPSIMNQIGSWFSQRKQGKIMTIKGPLGLYLYGSVGTGKTMIMDLFYNASPVNRKRRVHFHAFMHDVHKRIHQLRVKDKITSDPIPLIATELTNTAWLLCFDELQVTDITDAMILRFDFSQGGKLNIK